MWFNPQMTRKCFDVCLFVELFAEMVQMVDVSDGLEKKIIKKVVFIDYSTSS